MGESHIQFRERRQHPRRPLEVPGEITTDEGTFTCFVRNISDGGARVSVAPSIVLPSEFRLILADPEPAILDCFVRWRSGRHIGVQFVPAHMARLPRRDG